jgi:hypothetical protein
MTASRYPGTCTRCGQLVPAGTGTALTTAGGWQVRHAGDCPVSPHNRHDAPVIGLACGEGYGGTGFTPGQTIRAEYICGDGIPEVFAAGQIPGGQLIRAGRGGVSGIVTVVTAAARYYAEDGLSFGVGADEGHVYQATARPATAGEAAPVLAAEAATDKRLQLHAAVQEQFGWRYPGSDAAYPAEVPGIEDLPEVPLRGRAARHSEDQLLVDEPGGYAWTRAYNGADGDDWSQSNHGSAIALRYPLTPARRALIGELRAVYEVAAWGAAGIRPGAARALIAAGLRLQDTQMLGAFTMEDGADAAAWLARTPARWEQAGWGSEVQTHAHRFTPREAARLADAGIGYPRACGLRQNGTATVEAMLSAAPPAVPDGPGRYVIRISSGNAVITDQAEQARILLDRNPAGWAGFRAEPGPVPLHVTSGWQLWDDGRISRGGWHHRPGAQLRHDYSDPAYQPGRGYPVIEDTLPRCLTEAAVHLVSLLVGASADNRADWDAPDKRRVLTGAAHVTTVKIGSHRKDHLYNGSGVTLERLDVTGASASQRSLWLVTEDWWDKGTEDADAGDTRWLYPDEPAARATYAARRHGIH